MARIAVSLSCVANTPGREQFSGIGGTADPLGGATYASTLATLLADGASPTQAHVTAFVAQTTAPPTHADVVVSINTATVPSIPALQAAFAQLLLLCQGRGDFTQ
jgi:hypothetical protein